ncbi:hypothetical protein BK809_0000009 [Diplodia seriata]|uniref:Uncharacterized protein n=1 Tax=Diplodia seriata TaxID=420778 RepID=A0A1S8BPA1_9PEZI|nr:hypothetical protein BK809_0000009 [Diplodia seriata]
MLPDTRRQSAERLKGVWLNPHVRVAYGGEAYKAVNPTGRGWPSVSERIRGMWYNRCWRLFGKIRFFGEDYMVRRRLEDWTVGDTSGEGANKEIGAHCLINEMQVLVENGWKHV